MNLIENNHLMPCLAEVLFFFLEFRPEMNCIPLTWSPSTADALNPTIIVCSIAAVIHTIFWIQVLVFPILRQRNMMWLYTYLITDLFLLARFFLLYLIRREHLCLHPTFQIILCYFEASSKFYINAVQSYLLLALNGCRYAQIVWNRNMYLEYSRRILLLLLAIIILPAFNLLVQFLAQWTFLWHRTGGACDIWYQSLSVQIFNLFVVYIIPIVSNLFVLAICIRHVSSIRGIRSQQIINLRRKHQRVLLFQTITFYSIWLVLWSPNILAFQFINVNSDPGIYTSLVNYMEITIDPIIVALLDIRFWRAWQSLWRRIRGRRQAMVAPGIPRNRY